MQRSTALVSTPGGCALGDTGMAVNYACARDYASGLTIVGHGGIGCTYPLLTVLAPKMSDRETFGRLENPIEADEISSNSGTRKRGRVAPVVVIALCACFYATSRIFFMSS